MVAITVKMTEDEAWVVAQFLKRTGFSDYRAKAVDDDEAYLMRDAADEIMDDLADAGIVTR